MSYDRFSTFVSVVLGLVIGSVLASAQAPSTPGAAVATDHKDPIVFAQAVLEAYKVKDAGTLAALSAPAVQKKIAEVAAQGEAHPQYKTLFGGWPWDAVQAWDGKFGDVRYERRKVPSAQGGKVDGIVSLVDFTDGSSPAGTAEDRVATVVLIWNDGGWAFGTFERPRREDFTKLDRAMPQGEKDEVRFARRAVGFYGRDCEGGDGWACHMLAEFYTKGFLDGPDDTKASEFRRRADESDRKACDGGSAEACDRLADRQSGDERAELLRKEAELLRQGCDRGDAEHCARLLDLFARSAGLVQPSSADEKDELWRKTAELLGKACDEGSARACRSMVGYVGTDPGRLTREDFVKQDEFKLKAEALFKKACDGGDARSCFELSTYLIQLGAMHPHWEKNEAEIPQLQRKACELGSADACRFLAQLQW